jgi:8-oxo-dGTP diphosphatase
MPLARFVALHSIAEEELAVHRPRFAVVLAHATDGVLLVFNRFRKVWELPGGLLEPDDTPRSCAIRELWEEAGCEAGDLTWMGLVEVNDGQTHLGAVYGCRVRAVPSRFESDETDGIAKWSSGSAPSPLGESDAALLHKLAGPLAESTP